MTFWKSDFPWNKIFSTFKECASPALDSTTNFKLQRQDLTTNKVIWKNKYIWQLQEGSNSKKFQKHLYALNSQKRNNTCLITMQIIIRPFQFYTTNKRIKKKKTLLKDRMRFIMHNELPLKMKKQKKKKKPKHQVCILLYWFFYFLISELFTQKFEYQYPHNNTHTHTQILNTLT